MVHYLTQIFRLIYINYILARNGLDQVIVATRFFAPFKIFTYLNPWNWSRNRNKSHGQRIRETLEDLGPIFIKFGQILSTRRDILSDDIANELALLQDRVPPFSGKIAQKIIEKELDCLTATVFAEFDTIAHASASIAQVHIAKLLDGTEVVIKVLRPKIEKVIRRDIALLYTFAWLIERFWSDGRRLRPKEVVAEFERTIYDELDLMREAANASQLRRNFQTSDLLYVPEIFWTYCRPKMMVMERIHGIAINDVEALRRHGINLKLLAERCVEIFFTQVIRDTFFHADMHPGNIFVSTKNTSSPQCIAIDFGIMGTLGPRDQRYLAENMLAFFNRDYRRVAELHVDSGWVPIDTRVDEFEAAIRTVCEPIFERPLRDISCAQLLLRLFQTAKRFEMEVQPQLLLLQKTLLYVEGLGRQIYPDLDLWSTAKPFLERWLKRQMGPRAMLKNLRIQSESWSENLPEIPNLLHAILQNTKQQQQQTLFAPTQDKKPKHFGRLVLVGLGLALALTVTHTHIKLPPGIVDSDWWFAGIGIFVILAAFIRK